MLRKDTVHVQGRVSFFFFFFFQEKGKVDVRKVHAWPHDVNEVSIVKEQQRTYVIKLVNKVRFDKSR